MRNPLVAGVLMAAGVLACGDPPTEELQPVTSIRVEGKVTDPAGAPVSGAYASLRVWLSPPGPADFELNESYDATGPDGTFTVGMDGFAGAAIDSIRLVALAPGCEGPRSAKVIRGGDLPEGPQATLSEDFVVGPVAAAPTTVVGEVCAIGAEPVWGMGSYWLIMSIDSVDGQLVQGRWTVVYRHTSVGPDGTFEGVQSSGILVLVLTPAPFPGCTEVRVAIPVSATGAWGRAEVAADVGCLPVQPLTFAPVAEPIYFPSSSILRSTSSSVSGSPSGPLLQIE